MVTNVPGATFSYSGSEKNSSNTGARLDGSIGSITVNRRVSLDFSWMGPLSNASIWETGGERKKIWKDCDQRN